MSVKLKEEIKPPITLTAKINPNGEAEATIPIRWCVNSHVVEQLTQANAKFAHVVLSVVRNGQELKRYAVPLNAEMTYVRFSKPGKHEIHATVMWNRDGNAKDLRSYVHSTSGKSNQPIYTFMDSEGQSFLPIRYLAHMDILRLDGEDVLPVVVPEEMFAAPPPQWLKTYTGFFFKSAFNDECDVRRRTIIAGLLSPVFALLMIARYVMLVLLVIFGGGFFGLRKLNYKAAFLHPFADPAMSGLVPKGVTSRWIENPDGSDREPFWVVLFSPPVLLVGLGIFLIIKAIFHMSWLWVAAVPILLGIVAIIIVTSPTMQNFNKTRDAKKRKKLQEQKEREAAAQLAELESMVCNGYREPSLASLQKQHRTIRLRYDNLKSKVCRPYAR